MLIKDTIVSEIKRIKIPDLISCSIIGSFIHKEKFGKIEDVDIYLILNHLDAPVYRKITHEFNKICKKLSTETIKFVPEFRAGAFKPKPQKGKKVIQFHILINTPEMLEKKSPMVSLDWALSNICVLGKSVSDMLKARNFSKDELLNGRDGLNYFLELLRWGKKTYMEWAVKGSKIERVKKEVKLKTKEEWFDLIQFVVITGFTNFIRLSDPKFLKIESEILKRARTLLPDDHYGFLNEVIVIKNRLKIGSDVKLDIKGLKNRAISFIEYMIRELE